MKLDLTTLILVQSIVFAIQAIVLFLQYRSNHAYPGTGWWVAGVSSLAFGVTLMPFVRSETLWGIAVLANPFMVLGEIFLYVGILRFFGKKESPWKVALTYAAFLLSYLFFVFIEEDLSARTVLVNFFLAAFAFLTARQLLFRKNVKSTGIEALTGGAFLFHASFLSVRAAMALALPQVSAYNDNRMHLDVAIILFIVVGMIWTYGFIMMVSQRLNRENLLEKEKMQNVFNTGPDAMMFSRLADGTLIDVNERFSVVTGYTREESLGKTTLEIGLWHEAPARNQFVEAMNNTGFCENMEFEFGRKDGSRFIGALSSRPLMIDGVLHAVSLIRDMTEHKQAETQIQQLIQQLEKERNSAQLTSVTDSLTGLSNRRYFDEALKKEFFRLKRTGADLSLIMMDVDFFKAYNDRYGHMTGDKCLRCMAEVFRKMVMRAPDIVARYGGEEFMIILPNTNNHGATALAEEIRKAVEALELPHESSSLSKFVTISLGVATGSPSRMNYPDALVGLVDDTLYQAKHAGRNCVKSSVHRSASR